MANKIRDLRRKRFGKLVAIKREYDNEKGYSYWLCVCDCGNEARVLRQNLLGGKAESCGCLASEETSKRSWKGVGDISGTYWNDVTRNAKYRAIEFSISINEAWELFLQQNAKCLLSGETLSFYTRRKRNASEQTASLDRIDNTKGYTKDNCCWLHKRVNRLKNDFSQEELLFWANKLVEHNERQARQKIHEDGQAIRRGSEPLL